MSILKLLDRLVQIGAELKRSNDLAEQRLKLDYPGLDTRTNKRIGAPKIVSIEHPTTETWSKRYKEQHPQEEEEE